MGSWIDAAPTYLVAALILILPGGLVIATGWGVRNPFRLLLAPAVSVTIAAVAATVAPFVGVRWGLLPLAAVTVVVIAIAALLRRFARPEPAAGDRRAVWTGAAFAVAAAAAVVLFARAFGAPENIAQRFDNIVHLNAVGLALQTGDSSPMQIGATSDIGAYPNAWHAVTTLAAELTGASVPVAVNASNLAFVSILWTASIMALSGALLRDRTAAYVAAAALSLGFGAFPALFFNWGVLYPNVVGYAMLPALLASVALALRGPTRAATIRALLLVALLAGGTFLGHPNAFLAGLAFSAAYVVSVYVVRAVDARTTRGWVAPAVATAAFVLAIAVVWAIGRTSAEHSGWSSWETSAQAFGEGVLISPRGFAPTIVSAVLLLLGLIAVARHPRLLPAVAPFLVAIVLFVVSAGFPTEHWLRQWLTNPWYNDPNRLAALLPIAGIPVAALGVVRLVDAAHVAATRRSAPRWVVVAATVGSAAVLFSVVLGPNLRTALSQVREAYAYTDDALLVSSDEKLLLDRLEDETPEDALIIGSPRTGASLALALADRTVTERHIFGSPSDDLRFLNTQLRNIDEDPEVCRTVDALGVDYVLDFGRRDVIDESFADAYDGVQDLEPGRHLELVDSEGDDARLFRIEGC
jgi:hypothetical protein